MAVLVLLVLMLWLGHACPRGGGGGGGGAGGSARHRRGGERE